MYRGMGSAFFKRFHSWLDFFYVIFNMFLFSQFWQLVNVGNEEEFHWYKETTMTMRFTIVCGIIIQFLKLGYFLGLVDQISPMIDIIYRIVYDIGWFTLVLVLMSSAFAYAFYILAQS